MCMDHFQVNAWEWSFLRFELILEENIDNIREDKTRIFSVMKKLYRIVK